MHSLSDFCLDFENFEQLDFTNTLYEKLVTATTSGIQSINQPCFGLILPIKTDLIRFHIRNKTPAICVSQQNFPCAEKHPRSSMINKKYRNSVRTSPEQWIVKTKFLQNKYEGEKNEKEEKHFLFSKWGKNYENVFFADVIYQWKTNPKILMYEKYKRKKMKKKK